MNSTLLVTLDKLSATTFKFLSASFNEITSPTLTLYDGISTFFPLTVTCPWLTNCLAPRLVDAKPILYTKLSNLDSSNLKKLVPWIPDNFPASSKVFSAVS